MGFFQDIIALFKKYSLTFVEKKHEGGDVYTFIFKAEEGLTWKPGQHGILTIDHIKINKPTRPFSIASTPDEGIVMFSARVPQNPSEFKQALFDLKQGEKLSMRGPIGSFYSEDPLRPLIFIAGGIGITPYRALLNKAVNGKVPKQKLVKLLYGSNTKEYVYKDELDTLSRQNDFVQIRYLAGNDEFAQEVSKEAREYQNDAIYFLSGPPLMIKAMKKVLKDQGIKGKNIKADPFVGY